MMSIWQSGERHRKTGTGGMTVGQSAVRAAAKAKCVRAEALTFHLSTRECLCYVPSSLAGHGVFVVIGWDEDIRI
jgi:hypothetical protein